VGGNAWERRFQARLLCSLSFPGLKERFSVGTVRSAVNISERLVAPRIGYHLDINFQNYLVHEI